MMDAHFNLLITRRRPCSTGRYQENHLLLGSSAPPLEGGSGGCNVDGSFVFCPKEEAVASVWRDSRAAEEERERGSVEQKLLDMKFKSESTFPFLHQNDLRS